MRRILLIAALIGLIFLGWILKREKSTFSRKRIESKTDWPAFLVGNWKYDYVFRTQRDKVIHTGQIEYSNDNTYTLQMTIESFDIDQSGTAFYNLATETVGGTIEGTWRVSDDSGLHLDAVSCSLQLGEMDYRLNTDNDRLDTSDCYGQRELTLGDIDEENYSMKIVEFNKARISFVVKYFRDGGADTTTFTRLE